MILIYFCIPTDRDKIFRSIYTAAEIGTLGVRIHVDLLQKSYYFKVLKWARQKGCPWDKYTCTFASSSASGQIKMLK